MPDPVLVALERLGCPRETREYIGDGVYTGLDSAAQIWLVTEVSGVVHTIALEPTVLAALLGYSRRFPQYKALHHGR